MSYYKPFKQLLKHTIRSNYEYCRIYSWAGSKVRVIVGDGKRELVIIIDSCLTSSAAQCDDYLR